MLALICVFDLGPPLAFNDDWTFAWNVQHLNLFHIHLYPAGSALALPQIVWAWALTFGYADQRLLRLSIIPFVLLAMYALHQLARALGADRTWSAIAAIAPLVSPVFAADATTFMTDIPYVALLLVAALGAVRWPEGRKWILLCVVFATLATLQRQVGVMIPLAVTGALLLRKRHLLNNRDKIGIILLWAFCLAAVAVPTLTGITPPTQGQRLASILAPRPLIALADLFFLPGAVGLSLVLFLPGLAFSLTRSGPPRLGQLMAARIPIARVSIVRLLLVVLAFGELLALLHLSVFPGNVFTQRGFTATQLPDKLPLFAFPVYLCIEVAAMVSILLLALHWRSWRPSTAGWHGTLLLLLVITQLLPLILVPYVAFDRYYLPAALLLVPLVARVASQAARPVLAAWLALLLAVAGGAVYVVGEQDYFAWQVARNQAACLAYQYAPPTGVNAGYEANAVYVEVPYYERTGQILGGLWTKPGDPNFSLNGPANPIIKLELVGPNDPRPGYTYTSMGSGKVILLPRADAGFTIQVPPGAAPACP